MKPKADHCLRPATSVKINPNKPPPLAKINESFIVGVDISGEDVSCVTITRLKGSTVEIVNVLYGKDAEDMHRRMSGY